MDDYKILNMNTILSCLIKEVSLIKNTGVILFSKMIESVTSIEFSHFSASTDVDHGTKAGIFHRAV